MSWAARRRLIILTIVGAVVVAFLVTILIATLYKTPTCSDGVQNQSEAGIDCGGPCPYLCTSQEQPPIVLFTQVLRNSAGRTDIIAMVENKNATAAAKNIPFTITLYGVNHIFIQQVNGMLDLPPGATEPVYVPGIVSGNEKVTSAFLDIAASAPQWFALAVDNRIMPIVSNTTKSSSLSGPRIDATLTNQSVTALTNVEAIVLVYDVKKNIIAASQTIVPSIPAQGQADATFTWNNAFPGVPSLIEVVPMIPLP